MGKIKRKFSIAEKRSFVAAQDLKLIKALSGNDRKLRERVLRNLQKWFQQRSTKIPFTQQDFDYLWKGLFYTMWMSDKPLVQEECAEKIAKLIHFVSPESSLLFLRSGLYVIALEWFGIDQLRLDKFLMLVRRLLRQAFEVLKKNEWKLELVEQFGDILLDTVLKNGSTGYVGLTMHITEIYLEELAKVAKGDIEQSLVTEFVKPFIKYLSTLDDERQILHIQKFMFHHLLQQSDEGLEYQARFEAWKERGFAEGTIEAIHKIEAPDDEMDEGQDVENLLQEKPLDPRAGYVDVILPQLRFDAIEVSKLLHEHKFAKGCTSKARKALTRLAQEFEKTAKGDFPLGFKRINFPKYDGYSMKLRKSVNRLVKLDKKLLSNSNKNRKLKNKKKSQRDQKEEKMDADCNDTSNFQNQLQTFIDRSERNLTNGITSKNKSNLKKHKRPKSKITKLKKPSGWAFESNFRRNSGTWIVHRLDSLEDSDKTELLQSSHSGKADKSSFCEKNTELNKDAFTADKPGKNNTPASTLKTEKAKGPLFPQNEWDLPPKEGEIEIFVPSKKFKLKMEKKAKKMNRSASDALNNSVNTPVKKRSSLDANLVRNPYALNGTRSEKRVKIDLKLNRSQEIHEHQAQLRSSPAIPYDATKKPTKPLLKPNSVSSPINPFYKKKLKLL